MLNERSASEGSHLLGPHFDALAERRDDCRQRRLGGTFRALYARQLSLILRTPPKVEVDASRDSVDPRVPKGICRAEREVARRRDFAQTEPRACADDKLVENVWKGITCPKQFH